MIGFYIQSKMSTSRKAPYRKRKTVSPEVVRDYLLNENILDSPGDVSNIKISCGFSMCSAITANQRVISWGNEYQNMNNELKVPRNLTDVIDIANCDDYTLALRSDGTLVGWGNIRSSYSKLPQAVLRNKVKKIRGYSDKFLALLDNGTLVGWGETDIFDISSIPEDVYNESPIVDIQLGMHHAVALKANGGIICWGENGKDGLLEFPVVDSVKAISVSNFFSLALKPNGTLVGWGTNKYGQDNIPTQLQVPGDPVISFSVGKYHCGAITKSGEVYTWGWDVDPSEEYTDFYIDGKGRKIIIPLDPEIQKYLIKPPFESFQSDDETPTKIFCGNDINFVVLSSGDVISWGREDFDLVKIPEVIPSLERLSQPDIDLTKYGMSVDLDSILNGKFIPTLQVLQPVLEDTDTYIRTMNGKYKKGKLLGKGTFGATYEIEVNGVMQAVKIQLINRKESNVLSNLFNETIVQIIIQEENKRLNPGFRVCPDIYEVAYNKSNGKFYIFQEKLDTTFEKLIEEVKMTTKEFSQAMVQIAKKLNWLYDTLEYNHRDFKADNIMVKKKDYLLIDFGFSCLTYRGQRIKVKNYFDDEKCFEETRDLTHLLAYINYNLGVDIPKPLKPVIREMLKFKVRGYTCNLATDPFRCGEEISEEDLEQEGFAKIYDLLNMNHIYNPNATTDEVIARFKPYT